MPWRRKPASNLRYWSGPVNRNAGFKTILVYCLGPERPQSYHERCHHTGRLNLSDLPEWDWSDISAHLRCTKCGTVGFVDTRLGLERGNQFQQGYWLRVKKRFTKTDLEAEFLKRLRAHEGCEDVSNVTLESYDSGADCNWDFSIIDSVNVEDPLPVGPVAFAVYDEMAPEFDMLTVH